MFPTLVKVGNFEITTFGLMMFLAFVLGGWILAREFRRQGIGEELASSIVVAGAIGGIVGAKIYYAILFKDWRLLFDRAGLVWYGGLIGGFLAASWVVWRARVDYLKAADAAAPALSLGYALGRIGCFLVGDDYGHPSTVPWAVAFPEGYPPTSVPVHPTQLYEALPLFAIGWLLLRWRRQRQSDAFVLGRYLIFAGGLRFAIEFVRVNERVLGPLTVAHLASLAAVAAGVYVASRAVGSSPPG